MRRRDSLILALGLIFLGYLISYIYSAKILKTEYELGVHPSMFYFFWIPTFYFIFYFFLGKNIIGRFADIIIFFFLGLCFISYDYFIKSKFVFNDLLSLFLGTLFLNFLVYLIFRKKSS